MQAGKPDISSEAADEGTAAHSLAEKCLVNDHDAAKYIGTIIKAGERAFGVGEDMAENIQVYLDVVRTEHEAMKPGVTFAIEKQFHLDWLHKDIFGTNDALLGQAFGVLKVYDLKFGRGVMVDVKDNPQLKIYALGALGKKGTSTYEEVELVVVQPRKPSHEGAVRRWRIPVDELYAWGEKILKPGADLALTKDAPLKPGDWCKWCKALPQCEAVQAQACEFAKVAFDDSPLVFPPAEGMTGAEISKVLAFTRSFSSWASEVEAYARAQLDRGVKLPGWKLVPGRKKREWQDEAVARKALASFGEDLYTDPKFKTVAQVEKVIKKAGTKPDTVMAELVKITQKPVMAPASDPREEVVPAINAFADGDLE